MAKQIVDKSLIKEDVGLAIIKAFRINNKRAGEFKREYYTGNGNDETIANYEAKCHELRELATKAEENGFKIWVNFNGKTGHTYSKDYKPTPDSDNDWETFHNEISNQSIAQNNLIFGNNFGRSNTLNN